MRLKPPDGHIDASKSSNQDQIANISRVSSSHATRGNISGSSSIKWTRLNHNHSHPSVSSEPLIEDETSNPMVTRKFAYYTQVI